MNCGGRGEQFLNLKNMKTDTKKGKGELHSGQLCDAYRYSIASDCQEKNKK
jgi:hypothetical protein